MRKRPLASDLAGVFHFLRVVICLQSHSRELIASTGDSAVGSAHAIPRVCAGFLCARSPYGPSAARLGRVAIPHWHDACENLRECQRFYRRLFIRHPQSAQIEARNLGSLYGRHPHRFITNHQARQLFFCSSASAIAAGEWSLKTRIRPENHDKNLVLWLARQCTFKTAGTSRSSKRLGLPAKSSPFTSPARMARSCPEYCWRMAERWSEWSRGVTSHSGIKS
jgi:hypothetical protein